MRLTTRSTDDQPSRRRPSFGTERAVSARPGSPRRRGDPRAARAGDDAPAAGVRRSGRLRVGARADLPRLDLRRTRLERRRARHLPHARVGDDSVVVMGGDDGRPHAFLNVCRHRGATADQRRRGQRPARITCPYHAWSYGLDGELKGTPHMDGVEDFEPSCWGLIPVRVATVGGLVLVDLSGEAPDLAAHVGDLAGHLDHYRVEGLAPRRARHLRGGGQLEVDRRELQRVPALSRRAPRAERPEPLHERRGYGGSRRLVRRIDDAARRRGDDGARRRHRARPAARSRASPATTSGRSSTSCCSPTRSSRSIPTT